MMAAVIRGQSWTKVARVLRVEQYPDGRLMLWIRTPDEEAQDPGGQGKAQCHILFKPGDLPADIEGAFKNLVGGE